MIKEKRFYRTFLLLCLPIILQNVISLSVNLTDNLMLGRFSEDALSGVTAVNQIQFVYQNLLIGCGDGLVILATQYWGRQNIGAIKKISAVAMRTAIVIMAVLFLAVSFFPMQAVGLFTNDTDIIAEGVKYLYIVRFTYPFFCITTLFLAILRSVEIVKIAFYLSCSTLVINFCINYTLIFGNFGAPRMGAEGAAIGTLVARIVEFCVILFYIFKKEQNLRFKLRDFLHLDKEMTRDYYRVSLPVIFTASLWGLNNAAQTAILGHMTKNAIAANSMASNLYLIVKTFAQGAASGASVMIGKVIGEGNMKRVKEYAKTFQIIFVALGICLGLILYVLTEPVLSLYSFSEESRQLARTFLHILCFVMVGMTYQMPVNAGLIKGAGSTRYAMVLDVVSIWAIVIPLSFVMAFVLHASPVAVVWCLNSDQIFKCVPAFLKVNYGNWVKRLTR